MIGPSGDVEEFLDRSVVEGGTYLVLLRPDIASLIDLISKTCEWARKKGTKLIYVDLNHVIRADLISNCSALDGLILYPDTCYKAISTLKSILREIPKSKLIVLGSLICVGGRVFCAGDLMTYNFAGFLLNLIRGLEADLKLVLIQCLNPNPARSKSLKRLCESADGFLQLPSRRLDEPELEMENDIDLDDDG